LSDTKGKTETPNKTDSPINRTRANLRLKLGKVGSFIVEQGSAVLCADITDAAVVPKDMQG
jgi:hypothetical protein